MLIICLSYSFELHYLFLFSYSPKCLSEIKKIAPLDRKNQTATVARNLKYPLYEKTDCSKTDMHYDNTQSVIIQQHEPIRRELW